MRTLADAFLEKGIVTPEQVKKAEEFKVKQMKTETVKEAIKNEYMRKSQKTSTENEIIRNLNNKGLI